MVKTNRLEQIGISAQAPCFIIAEAGVNHNGDLDTACALVRSAKEVGANCVKFQSFSADRVASRVAPKAAYQLLRTDPKETQLDMLRSLELSEQAHSKLVELCKQEKILFLSTPYNIEDARMLDTLGVAAFKLASMHLVELPFLRQMATFGKPLILSTGMATMSEVRTAVDLLRREGLTELVVLQCTTNYPSSAADANLRAMISMRDALDVTVGYSDHTKGIAVPTAATALGARVIEKHFTLNCSLPGPDQQCSSDPEEFRSLVRSVREAEIALGSAVKEPTEAERRNIGGMRRSLVTRVFIPAGTLLTEDMISFKRPGTGISPANLSAVLGRRASRDLPADSMLELDQLI